MPFNFDEYVDDVQSIARHKTSHDNTAALFSLKDKVNESTRNKINRSESRNIQSINIDNSKDSQEQITSGEQVVLQIGTKVFVQWRRLGGTEYPGKIANINNDGTYNIQYDDGDRDENVTKNRISLTNNISNSLYTSRLLGLSGLLSGATNSLFLPSFQNLSSRESRATNESTRDSETDSAGISSSSFEQIALLQIARALHGGNDEIDLAALLGSESRQSNIEQQRNNNYDNNTLKNAKINNCEQLINERGKFNKSKTYVVVNPNEIIEMLSSIPTTRPIEI
jgi:hypothetical protein